MTPNLDLLPGYAAALAAGWSPNTTQDVSALHLAAIRADADAFLRDLARHEGGTVALRDGTTVPRLPGRVFWIVEAGDEAGHDGFRGAINLRFVPGTTTLPPHVSGHVGYAVAPWHRRRGIATRALALLLPVARAAGLARVQVTCDVDNAASRRVIEANGGVRAEDEMFAGQCKAVFWMEV